MPPSIHPTVRQPPTRPVPPANGPEASWVRWLLPVLLLVFVPGCYTYQVTDVHSLAPGEEVRIEVGSGQVTSAGYGSSLLGPRRLEARFTEATSDSLVVSLWIGSAYRGTPFESAHQSLSLPLSDIAQIENRQLSRPRTVVATVGTLALVWYLIDSLGLMLSFGGDEDGDVAPPDGIPEQPLGW